MGRPKKQIDQAVVEQLANRQATSPMIAAVVGCSTRTLKRRFGRHLPLWRESGKTRIITAQWEAMEAGNITMAIFLGKQYLGQSEKMESTIETKRLPDPLAKYNGRPDLLDKALDLNEEVERARQDRATKRPGANRVPGVGVPASSNGNGKAGHAPAEQPGSQPSDS